MFYNIELGLCNNIYVDKLHFIEKRKLEMKCVFLIFPLPPMLITVILRS